MGEEFELYFVQVGFDDAASGDVVIWCPPIGWAEVGSESLCFTGWAGGWFGWVLMLGLARADANRVAIPLQSDEEVAADLVSRWFDDKFG